MKICNKIRMARQSRNLTQEYVANQLHIDTANYGRIERGQTNLSMQRFLELCEILDKNPASFFEQKHEQSLHYLISNCENLQIKLDSISEKLDSLTGTKKE